MSEKTLSFWKSVFTASVLALLCALFFQLPSVGQISVEEILRKISATYQDAQSYRIVAERNVTLTDVGDERSLDNTRRTYSNAHKTTIAEVTLETPAPAKARLAVKQENQEMIFVSDGQRTWIYSPNRKEYMEVQGGAAHRDEQPGSSQGTGINPFSQYENLLVNRFRNLSTYSTTAVVEKEGNIKIGADKVKCYIVKIESPTGKHELWVDENRFLVLRSIDTSPTPQEGIATQTTVTFDVKEVNLSAKLEDALFSFAPPENAKKVDVLKGLTAKTP